LIIDQGGKMNKFRMLISTVIVMLTTFQVQIGVTQESTEPDLSAFKKYFKNDYFSIGAIMQFVFDYQNERVTTGQNGFNIANMRLQLKGEFDGGFGYFFQTNFTSSTTILDANMYYKISPQFIFQIGQFKAPFSQEFLIPAPDIDFVNRSQIVSSLAPGRQIGFQLSGQLPNETICYSFGFFNGNGFVTNNNDDNNFLYAGRLKFSPKISDSESSSLDIGVNAAYSQDTAANLVGGLLSGFAGNRLLIGSDVRLIYEKILLSGEYIYANLEADTNITAIKPSGFHATAGYMFTEKMQMLVRWDSFELKNFNSLNTKSDLLILGINYWPTGVTEIQLNYIIDTDHSDLKYNQILINAQIVF